MGESLCNARQFDVEESPITYAGAPGLLKFQYDPSLLASGMTHVASIVMLGANPNDIGPFGDPLVNSEPPPIFVPEPHLLLPQTFTLHPTGISAFDVTVVSFDEDANFPGAGVWLLFGTQDDPPNLDFIAGHIVPCTIY